MKNNQTVFISIKKLWRVSSSLRKKQFIKLLLLMVIASVAEIFSIGAVIPFISVITKPDQLMNWPILSFIANILKMKEIENLTLVITLVFCTLTLFSGVMRLILLHRSTSFAFLVGKGISYKIYFNTLSMSYAEQIEKNTSEVISGITTKSNTVIYGVVVPCIVLVSSSIILLAIIAALIYMEPVITFLSFIGLGSIYVTVILVTKKQLKRDSQIIARESTRSIKILQEGLGGIRDVLIDGTQLFYAKLYEEADSSLRKAQALTLFTSQSPRYGVEVLGMIFIAFMAYQMSKEHDDMFGGIAILGAMALAMQKLLPLVQQIYSSWANIRSAQASLWDVLSILEQSPSHTNKIHRGSDISFKEKIQLKNISFSYKASEKKILTDINLEILHGEQVGIIGKTGSGKSTLIDLIMGLLEPSDGFMCVDGVEISSSNQGSWQKHLSHVPQTIFLADATIEENIAFGVMSKDINYQMIKNVCSIAQIDELIEGLPLKYKTVVGERGVKLSGGQRQRIGIARALYRNLDILILDEATSALDSKTEKELMNAVQAFNKNITIIIIAHRLETLRYCNKIIEIENGRIIKTLGYDQLKLMQ